MAERRTGSSKSALADLEKAFPRLQEEKIQIEAGMELIEIHTAAGDLDKAAATVGALRSLYPTNVEVLYAAYRIYSDLTGEAMLAHLLKLKGVHGPTGLKALCRELLEAAQSAQRIVIVVEDRNSHVTATRIRL